MILTFKFYRVTSAQWDFIAFMSGLTDCYLHSQAEQGIEINYKFDNVELAQVFLKPFFKDKAIQFKQRFGIKEILLNDKATLREQTHLAHAK